MFSAHQMFLYRKLFQLQVWQGKSYLLTTLRLQMHRCKRKVHDTHVVCIMCFAGWLSESTLHKTILCGSAYDKNLEVV